MRVAAAVGVQDVADPGFFVDGGDGDIETDLLHRIEHVGDVSWVDCAFAVVAGAAFGHDLPPCLIPSSGSSKVGQLALT
ncbi:MAG: hypothetical protein EKK33_37470 [Bradyrhizobiaceae bacterium]|nr:MAG: hypothetical protein EKK33_37470 [Bradyrhizobiaceae bacterium]